MSLELEVDSISLKTVLQGVETTCCSLSPSWICTSVSERTCCCSFPRLMCGGYGICCLCPPFCPPNKGQHSPELCLLHEVTVWLTHTHWLQGPPLSLASRQTAASPSKQQLGLDRTRRVILLLWGLDVLPRPEESASWHAGVPHAPSPPLPPGACPRSPRCQPPFFDTVFLTG